MSPPPSILGCPRCQAEGNAQGALIRLSVHLIDLHGNVPDPPLVTANCQDGHTFLVREWDISADREFDLDIGLEIPDADDIPDL